MSAATHDQIKRAAVRLFSERGFAATGIRDLADAAGVSTSALYHYMGTKDELLVHIMDEGLTLLLAEAEQALAASDRPEGQLGALVQRHVIVHAESPRTSLVIDNELRQLHGEALDHTIAQRDAYEKRWAKVIKDGVRDGVFDVPDQRFARLSLLEMCTGVARWYHPEGRKSVDAVVEGIGDLSLAMVRATRGRRPVKFADLGLPPSAEIEPAPTSLVRA
jgi:AcrR family transcriptional regulator